MLPKNNRLKKKKDFEKVFDHGKNIKGDAIYLKVLKTEEPFSRIGFIVSKKVSLKAVDRNKIKRRLRESAGKFLKTINDNMDIVIIASPKIKKNNFEEIKKDIEKSFKKIKNV
jgi:ribonuclease P protein component